MALSTRNQQTSAGLADALPAYMLSDEVEEVATEVIGANLAFADIDALRVAYCVRTDAPTEDDDGIDDIAGVKKAGQPWQSIGDYDLAVFVKQDWWRLAGKQERRAALTHALSHVMVDDKGKVKLLGHDVEAFVRETTRFGPWSDRLAKLWRSMGRDPKAEQTTVDEAVERAVDQLDGKEIRIGDNVAHITRVRGSRGRAE